MKSDTTTIVLNFALAALVILGVLCAFFDMKWSHEMRRASPEALMYQQALMKVQALGNDAAVYNATAKDPTMARILQAAQAKAPTR